MGVQIKTVKEFDILKNLVEKNLFIGPADVIPGLMTEGCVFPVPTAPDDPTPHW